MIRWLKKHARRPGKSKSRKTEESVPRDSRHDFMNHTYEEIPDVIPSDWRGIRSDSVPSFFLVGTSGIPDPEDSMIEPAVPYSVVSLSDSYSYETPTSCRDSTEGLDRLCENSDTLGSDGESTKSETETVSGDTEEIVYVNCGRDRLTCVRASCYHPCPDVSLSTDTCIDTPDTINTGKHRDRKLSDIDTVSLTTVSSLSSFCDSEFWTDSDVYSDNICVTDQDSFETEPKLQTRVAGTRTVRTVKTEPRLQIRATGTQTVLPVKTELTKTDRHLGESRPRLVASRNRLLEDLIINNYNTRMLVL